MSPGPRRARIEPALVLATALHAAALALVWTASSPLPRPSVTAPTPRPAEVEIALEWERAAEANGRLQEALAESAPPVLHRAGRRAAPPNPLTQTQSQPSAELEQDTTTRDEPESRESAEALTADRSIDLGIGPEAWRKWAAVVKPEADSRPHQPRRGRKAFHAPTASTSGGLQEGLEAHDRELGLGPSGPVLNALYRAAHGDSAPQLGVASFLVTVLKSGSVEVTLSGASDHAEAWRQVGARAAEALRKSPPRIPKPRSGLKVVIEIKAEEVFPNGLKRQQLQAPHLEAVAPRLRSTAEAKDDLQRSNPTAGDPGAPVAGQKAIVDLPGVYVAHTGKVCSYRAGLSVLGPVLTGGCDLANAGAKAQRLVRTAVREQAFF
jgi:hypothetical protein